MGFLNFEITVSQKDGYYNIIRGDGSKVKETISEGERSFIAFLYFYYTLKGSTNKSDVTKKRIVVIDDPVSSLDSITLFIVSILIKNLCKKDNNIEQMFILTHNVYFHKEITHGVEKIKILDCEKNDRHSTIEGYNNNPIKSSYELLWNEVKNWRKEKKVKKKLIIQ